MRVKFYCISIQIGAYASADLSIITTSTCFQLLSPVALFQLWSVFFPVVMLPVKLPKRLIKSHIMAVTQ